MVKPVIGGLYREYSIIGQPPDVCAQRYTYLNTARPIIGGYSQTPVSPPIIGHSLYS